VRQINNFLKYHEMKNGELGSGSKRICRICKQPLEEDSHGNAKAHKSCSYLNKKQHQKEKYKIGNSAKLMIQKNEEVAAYLYILDKERSGIPFLVAMEYGLKFNCPSTKRNHLNITLYMFDQFGYALETINGEHLIFIYHESEL
jgi:hypothetical protein